MLETVPWMSTGMKAFSSLASARRLLCSERASSKPRRSPITLVLNLLSIS